MQRRIFGLLALAFVGCGNASSGPGPVAASGAPSASPVASSAASASPSSSSSTASPTASTTAPGANGAPAASSTQGEEEDTGSARQRLMRRHFLEAAQVRAALVKGNLHEAGVAADALGNMDDLAPIPRKWKPVIERLQFEAKRIHQSVDIPDATAAFADIGATCGSCHRTNTGPNPGFGAPPPTTGALAARMQRHAWAMERLWEGLYAPSDASWKAGADALQGAQFPKEVTDRGGVHTRSAASRFGALVPSIAGETTPEGRAKVYASLLETCAACHVSSGTSK